MQNSIHDSRYFIDLLSLKSELLFRDYSKKTQDYYLKVVEEFLEATDKEIIDIGIMDIERYLDRAKEKLSVNTIIVMLDAFRFFFREIIGLDIADEVTKYKREFKFKEIMTLDQIDLLIGTVPLREKLMFTLIKETGMKPREINEVSIESITEKKGNWYVNGYKITKEMAKELIEYAEKQEDEHIFLSKQKKPIDTTTVRFLFKECSNEILNKSFAIADMRYGVALEMWKKGRVDEAVEYLQCKNKYIVKRFYKKLGYELNYYTE